MASQIDFDFDDRWIRELFQWADHHKILDIQYVEELDIWVGF